MQNLPRLMIVVTLLLLGTGWSVEAYLEGMEQPSLHASVQVSKSAPETVSKRDGSEASAPRRSPVVLSVDPTLEQAVSLHN
ncbi:MAG: hypothetical protein H6831_09785 [Planctomycetes bacterium]|nr:hypothetical protein [Planctomycetota bacterium]MCB9904684.1 hypothetical protein [Planctomycetota bacterium]